MGASLVCVPGRAVVWKIAALIGGFVRVRNWEKFQHYKDRNPPWIKLHTELLDNYEFARLHDASKLLAMCTWLLAARSNNKIPCDPAWIQSRCNLKEMPDLAPLIAAGFLEEIIDLPSTEQGASTMLADGKQDAIPRALARGEAEERQRQNSVRVFPVEPPPVSNPPKSEPQSEIVTTIDAALYAEARKIFGNSIGGKINEAIRDKGKPFVLEMIERCRGKDPEAARAYLNKSINRGAGHDRVVV